MVGFAEGLQFAMPEQVWITSVWLDVVGYGCGADALGLLAHPAIGFCGELGSAAFTPLGGEIPGAIRLFVLAALVRPLQGSIHR